MPRLTKRGAASLLARLTASGDTHVASAALALMAVEGRRRGFLDTNRMSHTELPAELYHKLVWWVAAAIREQLAGAEADRALADAALRALGAYDESDRVEAAALRLATAIDAQMGELPALLTHALGDRNVALFIALLGPGATARIHRRAAMGRRRGAIRYGSRCARSISIVRPSGGSDWSLSDDVEDLPIGSTPSLPLRQAEAHAVLASLALPADFRVAIAALAARR